ncbi:MAG: DUF3256 family protein [Bacteroides sp.]|nr:DUF3256 family protein [Bacteroides sp.]
MICKIRILILLSALLTGWASDAAPASAASKKAVTAVDTITAAGAFLRIPDQDLDIILPGARRDMVDYMEADSIRKTRNIYGGLSWIEDMTPGYMKVHLTDVSSLQVKILPLGKDPAGMVMTIYTVSDGEGTGADSALKFYTPAMQELKLEKHFHTPDPKAFYRIPKDAPVTLKELEETVPFYTMEFTTGPSTTTLKGRVTADDHLTDEERRRIAPYRVADLLWIWDGRRYRLAPDLRK